MGTPPSDEVAHTLNGAVCEEEGTAAKLLPSVYDSLRALAGSYFLRETGDHTLEPTALVHEAYVKLVKGQRKNWQDRAHFLAVAAGAMRQILADHARRKRAAKRGGGKRRVTLTGLKTPATVVSQIDLIALDEAMAGLAAAYPEQARIVEMRFLAGLKVDEVAHVLGVSESTVERKWRVARTWLRRELSEDGRV